jgi:hypothetical protein
LTLLLALGAVAAYVQGLRGTAALPRIVRDSRAMCEELPDYAALAGGTALDTRIAMRVDPADPRAGERFVCARLALAPRKVVARIAGEPTREGPEPAYLLVDTGEGATYGPMP